MKKSERLVGIYGGTFDPIHYGHLNLAIQIMEQRQLDEIWFCPVQINPHKQNQKQTPFGQRLKMLQIALANVPNCMITEIESKRPGPSYTIDTLLALKAESNQNFCLILGDDAIPSFFKWHQPEKIVQLVPLLIGRRLPEPINLETLTGDKNIIEAINRGMTPTRLVEISGTEIRHRIKEGLYCGHLLPEKVLDFIYKNQLYS